MNIALHGMETAVENEFGRNKIKLIRYADDFVVFAKTLDDILKVKEIIIDFLKLRGLNLSEEKDPHRPFDGKQTRNFWPCGFGFSWVSLSYKILLNTSWSEKYSRRSSKI